MNRRLGALLTLLAVVWLWLSLTYIPEVPTGGEPGPRAFPLALGISLGVLGVALALARPTGPPADGGLSSATPAPRTRMALGVFSLLVAYAFLLDKAGFILSTIALIVLAMTVLLRMRSWLLVAGLAVVFTFGCWVVFVSLLGVPLPGGSWMP